MFDDIVITPEEELGLDKMIQDLLADICQCGDCLLSKRFPSWPPDQCFCTLIQKVVHPDQIACLDFTSK
jgi:hypothetical protein